MHCDRIEVLLSGYIDNELTQQQRQAVENHLESCPACRDVVEELRRLQRETAKISIEHPSGREWEQVEKHLFQTASRSLGWMILIVWSIVTAGYALFQFALSPGEPFIEKILVFGLFMGLGLLFLSVLMERLRESRTDRYKGVLK